MPSFINRPNHCKFNIAPKALNLLSVLFAWMVLGSFSSFASAAPGAPSCTSAPSSATANVPYTISWCSASGATSYELVGERSGRLLTTSGRSASRTKGVGFYRYKVRGCNSSGCGPYGATTPGTNVVAATPPPARVGSISASPSTIVQGGQFTLSWSGVSGATSYNIYADPPGSSPNRFLQSTSGTSSTRTAGILGTYQYSVTACNSSGCSTPRATSLTTRAPTPSAPGGASVASLAPINGSYTISWGAASGTVTAYELFENDARVYSGTGRSVSRSHSTHGTRSYKVRACNGSSCSGFSAGDSIFVYTGPGTPPGFSASASTITQGGSTTLSWGQPGGVVSGHGYKLYVTRPNEAETLLADLTSLSSTRTLSRVGTYRFRVRSCNPNNLCGGIASLNVTVNPSVPAKVGTISGASQAARSSSLSLNWPAVAGTVDRYELYRGGALQQNNASLSATVTVPGTAANYNYRVRACNVSGCGPYSNNKTVLVYDVASAPIGLAPSATSLVVDSQVTLTWGASSNAVTGTTYNVYATPPGDTRRVVASNVAGLSSVRPVGRLGTYTYHVQGCNPGLACGSLSTATSVNITAPAIGTPGLPTAESITPINTDYTITWPAATGSANSYVLYENGVSVYEGTVRSFSLSHAAAGQKQYRVQACHKPGICGGLSPTRNVSVYSGPGTPANFRASAPTLVQGESTTLSWAQPGGVVNGHIYKLYVTRPNETETFLEDITGLTSIRSLNRVGTYRFRVRSCNPNNLCGSFATLNVTVNPTAPGQLGALSGDTSVPNGSAVSLSWSALATDVVDRYEIQVNGAALYSGNTLSFSYTPTAAGNYSYRGRACNVSGCGAFSATRTVNVYGAPSIVSTFTASPNSVVIEQPVVLSWTAPSDALATTTYNLYAIRPVVGEGERTLETGLSVLTSTRSPGLVGDYVYRVAACSPGVGCGPKSDITVSAIAPAIGTPGIPAADSYVAVDTAYTVSWPVVAGANLYKLYELNDRTGAESVVQTGAARTYSTQHAEFGRRIYRVQACHNEDVCGDIGSTRPVFVYTGPGPVLNLTSSTAVLEQSGEVTLSWGVPGGSVPGIKYNIYVTRPNEAEEFLVAETGTSSIRTLNRDGEYQFRVQACNPGDLCGGSRTLSILVEENLPPTITGIPNQEVVENTETEELPFTIGDDNTPIEELQVTVRAEEQVAAVNAFISGTGANRTVRVKPVADAVGTATIIVTVSDGVLLTTERFVVTVTEALESSDGPSNFVASSSSIVQSVPVDLTWDAPTTPVDNVFYRLEVTPPGGVKRILLEQPERTTTRTLGLIGKYLFEVSACDPVDNTCSDAQSITITVNQLSLSATPILIGQSVDVTWNIVDAASCQVTAGGQVVLDNLLGSGTDQIKLFDAAIGDITMNCSTQDNTVLSPVVIAVSVSKLSAPSITIE